MGTRTDLLEAAAKAASTASAENSTADDVQAYALAAKTALEAAALAEDAGPGKVDAALAEIAGELEAVGFVVDAQDPADVLGDVLAALRDQRTLLERFDKLGTAYSAVFFLAQGLERDFTASGTETSARLAARIHEVLEDAAAVAGDAMGHADDAAEDPDD